MQDSKTNKKITIYNKLPFVYNSFHGLLLYVIIKAKVITIHDQISTCLLVEAFI